MAPAITVFVDKDCTAASVNVLTVLQKHYQVFTDAESSTPEIMFKYKGSNARFFGVVGNEWVMFKYDALESVKAEFAVSGDVGVKFKKLDWMNILHWVRSQFAGEDDYNLNTVMFNLVPKFVKCPEKIDLKNAIEPVKEESNVYGYDSELQGCDCMLIQITKPYTDKPYTVAIRKFSDRGYLPFFTALFISTSWGVCSHDIAFLAHVWKSLGMQAKYGDMNLEQRLKDDVEKCTPSENGAPQSEPEVYRLTIMEVKEIWSGKRKNIDQEFTSNKK